jgi:hypothetical protein
VEPAIPEVSREVSQEPWPSAPAQIAPESSAGLWHMGGQNYITETVDPPYLARPAARIILLTRLGEKIEERCDGLEGRVTQRSGLSRWRWPALRWSKVKQSSGSSSLG